MSEGRDSYRRDDEVRKLREKYGDEAVNDALRLHPHDFPERLEWDVWLS